MASWSSLRAAVHRIDLEEQAWIEALFVESRGLLDDGLGMFVYSYRVDSGSKIRLGSVAGQQTAPGLWRALSEWGADNEASLARSYRTGAGSLDDAVRLAGGCGVVLSDARPKLEPHAVGDVFSIVGHDASGFGVFLTAPRARRPRGPTSIERVALERFSAELAGVVRLRVQHRREQVARLSASETLVARQLLRGASDKIIARELGVSLSTVSTLTRRMRSKLGCRRGGEVLALASRTSEAKIHRRLEIFSRLTSSECDVASELLVGSSYAEIALRRGVSERTVASQCAAIFRKAGVSGRRELAAMLLGA